MNLKSIFMALAMVLTSSATYAQLRPGHGSDKPGNQDPGRPGQYQPPPGGGGGGGGHGGGGGGHGGGGHGGGGGGGGYNPPPRPPGGGHGGGGGGGYYPPPRPPGGGHGGGGGGYYPPPPAPPYYPPPAPPYYPPTPPPPSYGQRIVKQVYVGRAIQDEMYQLSYYADLSQYYGWEITAVRASTRPNSPYRTVASLVDANRSILATQTNPGYQIQLFPSRTALAGSQELYLWIQGSTFIETIEVELMSR